MAIDAVADEDKDPANGSLSIRLGSDLRSGWPASPLRGLPATTGVVRRFLADSRAGSARDANKLAVLRAGLGNKIADLQDFYGSDGTRTRDLRRDRPAF
jgi:hypothetical protein